MENEGKRLQSSKKTEKGALGSLAKPLLIIMIIASLITLTAYLILA